MSASFLVLAILAALPAAGEAADKKKDPGSKILCKSYLVTGSRVQTSRVCKTRAQWEGEKMRLEQEALEVGRTGVQQNTNVRNPDGITGPSSE